MIRIFSTFIIISILIIAGFGCSKTKNEKTETFEQTESISDTVDETYTILADTISYGVVVRNQDTTDKWQKKWLKDLKLDQFTNHLFHKIYSGELTPYSYFEEEPLTIQDIKKLEEKKEFEREKIGKIQFKEIWYFDPDNMKMVKKIYSVMLAYEIYDSDGSFRGYKPAFKVYFNQSSE